MLLLLIALAAALPDTQCKYTSAGVITCTSTYTIDVGPIDGNFAKLMLLQTAASIALAMTLLTLVAYVLYELAKKTGRGVS